MTGAQHVRAAGRWLLTLPQILLIALVRGYRFFLKPWLGNACRFEQIGRAHV